MYPHVTLRLLESFDRPNIRMHVSSRILWLPEVLRICPYDFCFQSSHSSQPLWHLSSYSRFSHIQVHSEEKQNQSIRRVISHLHISPQLLPQPLRARCANNSTPQEPLFLTENGKIATRFWFNKHFQKVLSASGISPEHNSIHSFWIGAATTAASTGISDETIRVMGRWSSEAYRLYIRYNLNDLHQAQAHISSFKPLGVF